MATRLSAVAESWDRILAPCKYCKAATAAVAAEDVKNRKGQRAQKINTCFILKKKWVLCFNNKVKFRFRSGAGFASIVFWIRIRIKTLLSLVFWQQNHYGMELRVEKRRYTGMHLFRDDAEQCKLFAYRVC